MISLISILVARLAGAVVMAALALGAIWALRGGKLPEGRRFWDLFWWVVLPLLWALGGQLFVARFTSGLGAVTNLNDMTPWGLWVSFDVICGVALAAGGFVVAGSVHVLYLHRFSPVLRPAILTAFLGYILVTTGLLVDVGRPYNIWRPAIYLQYRSVLFEVAMCVMLYSTVLALEFLPVPLEYLKFERVLRVLRKFTLPIVIAGVVLSTLHQSSLGALFIIAPGKLLPLWYSEMLPAFFLLSAAMVGLAMVIVESNVSAYAFNKSLEVPIISSLAKAMFPLLIGFVGLRIVDVTAREGWSAISEYPFRGGLAFFAEMALLIIPVPFLIRRPGAVIPARTSFMCGVLVVLGVIMNRFNVSWIGLIPADGSFYVPSWKEIVITLNLISYGVVVFGLVARYMPLFHHSLEHEH